MRADRRPLGQAVSVFSGRRSSLLGRGIYLLVLCVAVFYLHLRWVIQDMHPPACMALSAVVHEVILLNTPPYYIHTYIHTFVVHTYIYV